MFTKRRIFFSSTICFQPCLLKNPKYTFYTIKSSLKLAYKSIFLIHVLKEQLGDILFISIVIASGEAIIFYFE